MAGTATLKEYKTSPDKLAFEVMNASLGAGDTTVVITPTQISAIHFVTVTPKDATSCAADLPYLTSFTVGDSTVTITGANSTEYLVKIEGTI